jgi:hypothetical protein
MDSLTAMELKRCLEADIGQSLPTTLAFNYPAMEAVAEYLGREVLGLGPKGPAAAAVRMLPPEPTGATLPKEGSSEEDLLQELAARLERLR